MGFRKGASTELQLARTAIHVKELTKEGQGGVMMNSFDILGAFDHINQIDLMRKEQRISEIIQEKD